MSWQTVSRRVKEYEAAQAVAQPVVQPEPVASTPPLSKPSAVAEVIPEQSRIELDPPPELEPALPVDNAEGLLRGRPWLDQDLAFKSWRKIFFVVNGSNPVNLAYCGNNGWFAVALERWHESFAALALFEEATHIWVILNPADDNEAFLHSFVQTSKFVNVAKSQWARRSTSPSTRTTPAYIQDQFRVLRAGVRIQSDASARPRGNHRSAAAKGEAVRAGAHENELATRLADGR